MDRRESKYHSDESLRVRSRVSNNEHLYDELNNKIVYEEIVDIKTDVPLDLSMIDSSKRSRENYNQIREYHDLIMPSEEKDITVVQSIKETTFETKKIDINAILEEAKKNRPSVDELEKKRNLGDDDMSVLSSLNRKYLHKKDMSDKDTEELKDLINTITSNNLLATSTNADTQVKDDKDLLSDLMTESVDKISVDDAINSSVLDEEGDTSSESGAVEVNSFYTKSMEIKDEDLEAGEDDEVLEEEKGKNGFMIAFTVIMIVSILLVAIYFTIKHFGIELF